MRVLDIFNTLGSILDFRKSYFIITSLLLKINYHFTGLVFLIKRVSR